MPRRPDLEQDPPEESRLEGVLRVIQWDDPGQGRFYRLTIARDRMQILHLMATFGRWRRTACDPNATHCTLYKSWLGFGPWKLRIRAENHGRLAKRLHLEPFDITLPVPEDEIEAVREGLDAGGYLEGQQTAEPDPVPTPEAAWNQELFDALRDSPGPETAAVLGDWLSEQGDPRGELIGHQLAGEPFGDLLHRQERFFYGEELDARPVTTRAELVAPGRSYEGLGRVLALWRWGFLESLAVPLGYADWDREGLDGATFTRLLEHPSARMLQELVFQVAMCDDPPQLPVLPTVESVRIGDFLYPEECEMSWSQLGSWDLRAPFPNLRRLHLQGGFDRVTFGPGLEELVLESSTATGELVRSLITQAPRARRITIWTGAEDYGSTVTLEDLTPLFDRDLEHLGVMNCAFTDALIAPLARSGVLKGLVSLDLSLGTLSDEGARTLLAHAPAFAHLTSLNLDENDVHEQVDALREAFGDAVSVERQKDDHGYGAYVSVAE